MADLARHLQSERVLELSTIDGPVMITMARDGDEAERVRSVHDDPGNRLTGAPEAGALAAVAAGYGTEIYRSERYELIGFDGRYTLTLERNPGEPAARLARATRDGAPLPLAGELGLSLLHRLAAATA
jgi:hypothetical protein